MRNAAKQTNKVTNLWQVQNTKESVWLGQISSSPFTLLGSFMLLQNLDSFTDSSPSFIFVTKWFAQCFVKLTAVFLWRLLQRVWLLLLKWQVKLDGLKGKILLYKDDQPTDSTFCDPNRPQTCGLGWQNEVKTEGFTRFGTKQRETLKTTGFIAGIEGQRPSCWGRVGSIPKFWFRSCRWWSATWRGRKYYNGVFNRKRRFRL